ncbi:hypothetical protein BS47DRAFT_1395788 [Hydnum rufescens UP504]|uniref:Uncharacterized protein n=1 Tax=Hydnum rufescens UP504 TaxID=1448309 RepID=A0A9P6DTL4_9AGAM|nr:hypothetical protein BS47DRAFT_1395788 [Hydnum rufescens UP504]
MHAQRLLSLLSRLHQILCPLPYRRKNINHLYGRDFLFTIIAEAGHDAFTLATGAGGVVTSVAGSVFTVATADGGSIAGKVFTDITSLGGHEFTVVSDQAGHIATLAVSGAGIITLVTNTVGSNSAARLATSAPWLPAPIIIALGSVAAGAMLGAGTVIHLNSQQNGSTADAEIGTIS